MATDPTPRTVNAANMRARFIMEMAAAMVADDDQVYREPELYIGTDGESGVPVDLSASSTLDGVTRVVGGEIDLCFLNPSSALTVACRGKGTCFTEPLPLCAVTVLPSRDQCMFAVHASTGLTHVEDIGREKYPLKIGMRGRAEHWLNIMLEDIFKACGFSIAELESWGGEVRRAGHIPRPDTQKFKDLVAGKLTGVFDEGVHGWADFATPAGLTVLKFEDETLAKLEDMGYRRDLLEKAIYPNLPEDIPTLDFSGWPIFVREDADDDTVRRFCAGLEARKDMIPWEGTGPLPLDRMCSNTPEAPLGVPLHRAAEKFWAGCGYL